MKEIEITKITQVIDGPNKGFYIAHLIGSDGPIMKNKSLSKLLAKLSKYYRGQEK